MAATATIEAAAAAGAAMQSYLSCAQG